MGDAADAFDVLIVQLVTARTPNVLPGLQGPVLTWFGPVWFSAHVLLLAGYGLVGAGRMLHRVLRGAWALVAQSARPDQGVAADVPDAILRRAWTDGVVRPERHSARVDSVAGPG